MIEKIIKLLVRNALRLDNAGWGGKGWKEDYKYVAQEIYALRYDMAREVWNEFIAVGTLYETEYFDWLDEQGEDINLRRDNK